MLNEQADYILSDNRSDTHGFKRTSREAFVVFRGWEDVKVCRDLWVDHLGDYYVIAPDRSRFVKLESEDVHKFELYGEAAPAWEPVSQGMLVRSAGLGSRTYELLEFQGSDDFERVVDDDERRAYLWYIDLDDFSDEKMMAVLDTWGCIDVNAKSIDEGLANEIGCSRILTLDSLHKVMKHVGDNRLVEAVVTHYGDGWAIPETYHDRDEGYNGPWRESFDPMKLPWGSLTNDELVDWMCRLGCAAYAPMLRLDELAEGGYDGTAYVFYEGKPMEQRSAFRTRDVAEAYRRALGVPNSLEAVDIKEGRHRAEWPDDTYDVIEHAPVTLEKSETHGVRRR